jgi:alpha-1,3/alpha-1,6-mannosyltransferase
LIYTPENEHFGIVPLEAMLAGIPVLATNTGGPLETIYDGRIGWLRSPEKITQWTDVLRKPLIPSSAGTLRTMGEKGRERVLAEFSHTKMTESLDKEVQALCSSTGKRQKVWPDWFIGLSIMLLVMPIVAGFVAWRHAATVLKKATDTKAELRYLSDNALGKQPQKCGEKT